MQIISTQTTCNEISHDQQCKHKFMSQVSQTVSVAIFMRWRGK